MDVETERESDEQLFSAGYSEENNPDEEDEVSFEADEADDYASDDFKDE